MKISDLSYRQKAMLWRMSTVALYCVAFVSSMVAFVFTILLSACKKRGSVCSAHPLCIFSTLRLFRLGRAPDPSLHSGVSDRATIRQAQPPPTLKSASTRSSACDYRSDPVPPEVAWGRCSLQRPQLLRNINEGQSHYSPRDSGFLPASGKKSGAPNFSTPKVRMISWVFFATMKSAKALPPSALTLGHLTVLSSITW